MLRKDLLNWLDEMPVYGFNSNSYDLNVIKKYSPQILAKQSKKQGNIQNHTAYQQICKRISQS